MRISSQGSNLSRPHNFREWNTAGSVEIKSYKRISNAEKSQRYSIVYRISRILQEIHRRLLEKFEWTSEQQNAFDILKEKLTTAPVLKYPDFTQEFIVTTDASDYAIGAVLSQGTVGQDRPIAYASRVLSRAEQNYSTTEKELL